MPTFTIKALVRQRVSVAGRFSLDIQADSAEQAKELAAKFFGDNLAEELYDNQWDIDEKMQDRESPYDKVPFVGIGSDGMFHRYLDDTELEEVDVLRAEDN